MTRCEWIVRSDGLHECVNCKHVRRRRVVRECPAFGGGIGEIDAVLICYTCERHPCLGYTPCEHHRAVLAGETCPWDLWP